MLNLAAVLNKKNLVNTFLRFKWQQSIYALPSFWTKIMEDTENPHNLLLPKHHLIKKNTLICIQKLNLYLSFYAERPLNQLLRTILTNYLKLTALTGNRYIFYLVW